MTSPYGMTVEQLYNILNDMRKIYDFEENKTYVTDMLDMKMKAMSCLEITTFDAATGVQITMQKGANHEETC